MKYPLFLIFGLFSVRFIQAGFNLAINQKDNKKSLGFRRISGTPLFSVHFE